MKKFLYLITLILGLFCLTSIHSLVMAASQPKAPVSVTASNAVDGVNITWRANGADAYVVYRLNSGKLQRLAVTQNNSYRDTQVKNNTAYGYYVKAYKNKAYSAYSKGVSLFFMSAPTHGTLKNADSSITFSWNPVQGAEKYYVYKSQNGSGWTLVKAVKSGQSLNFTDTNVRNNVSYNYAVRCAKRSYLSSYIKSRSITRIDTPSINSVSNTASGVFLQWSSVSGADNYIVFRSDNGNACQTLAVLGGTAKSYHDKQVSHGGIYLYSVAAINGNSVSALSDYSAVMYLSAGEITQLTCTQKGIYLKWNTPSHTTKYALYRKVNNSTQWTRLGTFTTDSYTDKNVSHGIKYTYTLVQYNNKYKSSFNSTGFSKIYLDAPSAVKTSHSPEGVKIYWSAVEGSDGYALYRKNVSQSSWVRIALLKGVHSRSYTDSDALYGKENQYRVCAYTSSCGVGCLSDSAVIKAIDPHKKVVALTFDDGPYAAATNKILDCLEAYDCKATFYVVGSRIEWYPQCLTRAASLGCEVGNHSFNHTNLTTATDSEIENEINSTNDLIRKYTGKNTPSVRAPGGAVDSRVKSVVQYPLVNWSVDTLDWKTRSAEETVKAVQEKVFDGSIILMHDLYLSTADATNEIVPWLIANGYQLVTVSELMQVKGVDFTSGKLYTRG